MQKSIFNQVDNVAMIFAHGEGPTGATCGQCRCRTKDEDGRHHCVWDKVNIGSKYGDDVKACGQFNPKAQFDQRVIELFGLEKSGMITIPNFTEEVAEEFGLKRARSNDKLKAQNPKYQRPDAVDVLGISAEMAMQVYLSSLGISYMSTRLYSPTPMVEPDIIIDSIRVDVKGVRMGYEHLLVNLEAHKKKSEITHYCWVQALSKTRARFLIRTWEEVDEWPEYKHVHSWVKGFQVYQVQEWR